MENVIAVSDLRTPAACRNALARLLDMSDEDLASQDIALVNLVCATGLPGNENLDIAGCLKTIDEWTEHVRDETVKGFPRYHANPNPDKGSEAVYRLWQVMYALRFGKGLTHRMTAEANGDAIATSTRVTGRPYKQAADSEIVFIDGLLGPRRIGSCSSLPVLFAAVGRRLGYPVKLVLSVQHIFNRWVSATESFNMDGCAKVIAGDDYEHYIDWPRKWRDSERTCGVFLRPATPREELAAFVFMRCIVLSANLQFDEAYRTCQIVVQLSPENPGYQDELGVIDEYRMIKRARSQMTWTQPPTSPILSIQPPLQLMPALSNIQAPFHLPHRKEHWSGRLPIRVSSQKIQRLRLNWNRAFPPDASTTIAPFGAIPSGMSIPWGWKPRQRNLTETGATYRRSLISRLRPTRSRAQIGETVSNSRKI